MTKVFIGGSRHVSRLNVQVRERLDNIMAKGFPIVVGDANGADKAVQKFLHSHNYENVEVFCSEDICRNNVGLWRTRNIKTGSTRKNAQFYSAKDRAMSKEATVGLMIWDGKSVGTLLNVYRLINLQKKALMFSLLEKRFCEFSSTLEWESFLASREFGLQHKIEQRTKLEPVPESTPLQSSFFG